MPEPYKKRALAHAVDLGAGYHRYVNVEGVGECRENFAKLVAAMDAGNADVVVVSKAEYLFVDTSPLWMEKFIATAQRRSMTVADATTDREYDLTSPGDEADFRALGHS